MTGEIVTSDVLVAEQAAAFAGVLDVPDPTPTGRVPLLWHWLWFIEHPAQRDLGEDGHPRAGTLFSPPRAGVRRMWAGGSVRTYGDLLLDREATRSSRVVSTKERTGSSGPLTIVTAEHRISQDDRVRVLEHQTIIYRAPSSNLAPQDSTDEPPSDAWRVATTPALLFRFSALTYNAHRIHYDRDYAQRTEGYPGLVVHGPLQALAMAQRARDLGWQGDSVFDYRLVSPLFDFEDLAVCSQASDDSLDLEVRAGTGRRTAHATLTRETSPSAEAPE